MSDRVPQAALPIVQGITFQTLGQVAKLSGLLYRPKDKPWADMLAQIRESGDRTSTTTHKGRNHPCQTAELRCDHQGSIDSDYVNTQVQLGGRDKQVNRSKPETESTSVTQVNVHQGAYTLPLLKDALARAHDYSFRTGFVVRLDPAVAIVAPTVAGPKNYTCNGCGRKYVAMDIITLGMQLGGYPPRCPAMGSRAKVCDGTPMVT